MSDENARREAMTERELLLELLSTQDEIKNTVEGLKVTVAHWAGETLKLNESYKAARDAVSGLGDRVGRVERKQSEPHMQAVTVPAPPDGNGASQ